LARGEIILNPTIGLELPAVRGRRDRIAAPREAAALIAALTSDHALWSTAFYAGLRLGELQALRWENVDLDGGRIEVRRSGMRRRVRSNRSPRQGAVSFPSPRSCGQH
jgi:integrase